MDLSRSDAFRDMTVHDKEYEFAFERLNGLIRAREDTVWYGVWIPDMFWFWRTYRDALLMESPVVFVLTTLEDNNMLFEDIFVIPAMYVSRPRSCVADLTKFFDK